MNDSLEEDYRARIHRVMDYIEDHLDEEFTLDGLAAVACFSKYHFHRVFYSITGETLFQFIQRVRIEKAAMNLLHHRTRSITDIALACGFSSSALFSRVFRTAFGKSASAWRAEALETAGLQPVGGASGRAAAGQYPEERRAVTRVSDAIPPVAPVVIRDLRPLTVVYVRHTGPYKGDAALFERLVARLFRWAGPRMLIGPSGIELFNVYHDDPEITSETKLRVSVCIPVPRDPEVSGEIGKMVIPGGLYAFISCALRTDEFQKAWDWVFSVWLPGSGYEPDDRYAMERYPVQNVDETGRFLVDICIPVKPVRN